jgi:hypothetical protein
LSYFLDHIARRHAGNSDVDGDSTIITFVPRAWRLTIHPLLRLLLYMLDVCSL